MFIGSLVLFWNRGKLFNYFTSGFTNLVKETLFCIYTYIHFVNMFKLLNVLLFNKIDSFLITIESSLYEKLVLTRRFRPFCYKNALRKTWFFIQLKYVNWLLKCEKKKTSAGRSSCWDTTRQTKLYLIAANFQLTTNTVNQHNWKWSHYYDFYSL